MSLLIKGGRLLDPGTGRDGIFDLYIDEGIVKEVSEHIDRPADRIVDAAGLWVMPGVTDLHVHLRDPGQTHKETLRTGALAAAHGGVTTICAMPNTIPAADSPEFIREMNARAKKECLVHVNFIGAVTKGQQGMELCDIPGMKREGAVFISEDGKSVMDLGLYKKAMEIAAREGVTVLAHCEDKSLARDGVMNESAKSKELGLAGIPNSTEDVIVARDILLAKETGCRLHLCHCSTRDSVRIIELAKQAGIRVTAEVCPHHFTLTTDDIPGDSGDHKMNPPIREKEDRDALIEGLRTGIIDVISTDHAPHTAKEKAAGFASPFGIAGLETSVSLAMTELVHKGILTPIQLAERMSYTPAKILGNGKGSLAAGKCADITIIDPDLEYVIDRNTFVSMGRNTPFDGRPVKGKAVMTIVDGSIVYEETAS